MINDIGLALLQLNIALRKHGLSPAKELILATQRDVDMISMAVDNRQYDCDVDTYPVRICGVIVGRPYD